MKTITLTLTLTLTLTAMGEEGPRAQLKGRVFERGSIAPLPGATVTTSTGESTTTDESGAFLLDLAPGDVEVLIKDERHEALRVTEKLVAGQGVTVEYRLLALPEWRRRYETTVRGEARHEGERFVLKDEELHNAPGALGDPFRVVQLLPGVATPVPLLPLYVIRGASPGMNSFLLDGMRVPELFHFLLLSGVVHPRLIDRLDFYPGAYDASFGHVAGGVIDAETRPARSDASHGEVQIRLFDVSTLGEAKLPGGVRVAIAGNYGYPGPLIHLVNNQVDVSYWDYQLRIDWRGLTVELLGAYDSVAIAAELLGGTAGDVADTYTVGFHRAQIRERARIGRLDLEAALVGGLDEMTIFGGYGVRKLFLNGRLVGKWRLGRVTLQGGLDGEASRFTALNFQTGMDMAAPDQLGDLAGDRDGLIGGAYLQATAELVKDRLVATAGVRADVYHAQSVTLLGIDPRATVRAALLPWLHVSAGFGLYQQPPSFPVPLPGIDTYALQLGLQRAWSGSGTVEAELPEAVTFKATGFYQKFANINDTVIDFTPTPCSSPPPESLSGAPAYVTRQVDGQAYGMELLLRRHAGRFTGWVAYTLSRAERVYSCGLRPADFDQTHVLNVVAQVRLPWNLLASGRFALSTGRPYTQLDPDVATIAVRNNQRLPDTWQLDLRIDREWIFQRWALSVFLEAVNLFNQPTYLGVQYNKVNVMGAMVTDYTHPVPIGFSYILPSVGARGRF